MDRRNTLKNLMLASGVLVALPAWARNWKWQDVVNHPVNFTPDEQALLSAIADTILPPVEGVGALSTATDKYLQRVISDCYEEDVNDNVKKQLASIEAKAQALAGTSFSACSADQKITLLQSFGDSNDNDENSFFKLVKSETIRGFTTCQEVMTKYYDYKVAPGHYYGCIDVNS